MGCGASVKSGALDAVGSAGSVVGGTASMVGHGAAAMALTVADCATLGMVDSIGDARDEQFEQMKDGRDDAAAGFNAHFDTEWYRGKAPCDMSDWMSQVADETQITQMWIPGTHDTMADNGGDLAECQSWTLMEQLQSGLRVFDIRIKHDGDNIRCFHGIIDLSHDGKDAFADLEKFLTDHPKEALFIRVKKEGECGTHSCEFHDQCVKYMSKPELYDFKVAKFGCLSAFRGKVTPLSFGSHLLLFQQPLDVQDEYKEADEDKKVQIIMDHSSKARTPETLQLSFCSSVGLEGWTCFKAPSAVAYQVNKKLLDAHDKLAPGIYMFDFPGVALIKAIIARNQLKT